MSLTRELFEGQHSLLDSHMVQRGLLQEVEVLQRLPRHQQAGVGRQGVPDGLRHEWHSPRCARVGLNDVHLAPQLKGWNEHELQTPAAVCLPAGPLLVTVSEHQLLTGASAGAKAAAPYLPILDSVLDVDEPDHVERLCDLGRPVPDDLQALLGDGLGRDAAGGVACKSPPGALSTDSQSKRTCIVTGTSLADRSENSPRCCITAGGQDFIPSAKLPVWPQSSGPSYVQGMPI